MTSFAPRDNVTFQSDYFFNNPDDRSTPASPLKLPTKDDMVGPFKLGPVLGRGCTGTVRLGTHKDTGFKVAFKIMKKKHINSKPNLWAKVKREIAILKLIEHPHVLKLYDVYETNTLLYLVLENVRPHSLPSPTHTLFSATVFVHLFFFCRTCDYFPPNLPVWITGDWR